MKAAFLVNGSPSGAMGERAAAFVQRLGPEFEVSIAHRGEDKLKAILDFFRGLRREHPDLVYVVDMAFSGVLGAFAHKALSGTPVIIDTGDAITALARASGSRGLAGIALTAILEKLSLRFADLIVVRGSYHQEWLAQRGVRAEFLPDGVDLTVFRPMEVPDLRRQLDLGDTMTIGLVGSSIWNPRFGICYGWELVEAIHLLRDLPVTGLMIGGGDGIPRLRQKCAEYGIGDRVRFTGQVPYGELPRYINAIDVCLSTQSNDLAGNVRTTGKLPIYLACGRYVLATRCGQAARVLPEEMLVEYRGSFDPDYPARLASRIRSIRDPARVRQGQVMLAASFDQNVLARKLAGILAEFAAR